MQWGWGVSTVFFTSVAYGTILCFDMGQYFMNGLYTVTSFTNSYVCGLRLISLSLVTGVAILKGNGVMSLFDPGNLDSPDLSFAVTFITASDCGGNFRYLIRRTFGSVFTESRGVMT